MSTIKTYEGSCHCGAVRFSVDADLSEVNACNCSMCSRAGWLLVFIPASQFRLTAGADKQSDYLFNKKRIHHRFCSTCGVRTFSEAVYEGQPMVAVNVRTLAGVDPWSLKVKHIDGKSL